MLLCPIYQATVSYGYGNHGKTNILSTMLICPLVMVIMVRQIYYLPCYIELNNLQKNRLSTMLLFHMVMVKMVRQICYPQYYCVLWLWSSWSLERQI